MYPAQATMLTCPSLSPISVGRAVSSPPPSVAAPLQAPTRTIVVSHTTRFDRTFLSSVLIGGPGERRCRFVRLDQLVRLGQGPRRILIPAQRHPLAFDGAGDSADIEVLAYHQQLTFRDRDAESIE